MPDISRKKNICKLLLLSCNFLEVKRSFFRKTTTERSGFDLRSAPTAFEFFSMLCSVAVLNPSNLIFYLIESHLYKYIYQPGNYM